MFLLRKSVTNLFGQILPELFTHQLFLVLDSSEDHAGGWQQISITATDINQSDSPGILLFVLRVFFRIRYILYKLLMGLICNYTKSMQVGIGFNSIKWCNYKWREARMRSDDLCTSLVYH